ARLLHGTGAAPRSPDLRQGQCHSRTARRPACRNGDRLPCPGSDAAAAGTAGAGGRHRDGTGDVRSGMAQLFIDKDFFFEFGKLEKPVQDKVREVFGKFTAATHTGLHLEKVNNAQDPRMRTIRIDQFWRGVVLAPQTGDAYLLLKVLPHDDAYQWAARHRATVNTAIGVVEIRNATAIDEQPVTVPADTTPLFADVSDADLTRLGVDAQVLAFARTLTTADQLESARTMLPEAQYDVLYALAAGYTPEQVWQEMPPPPQTGIDPEDVVTAMARS